MKYRRPSRFRRIAKWVGLVTAVAPRKNVAPKGGRLDQRLGVPGGWLGGQEERKIGGFRWHQVARLGTMAA